MRKFTKKELKYLNDDRRKPILPARRKPESKLAWNDIIHQTAKKTGFTETDTKEVLNTMIDIIEAGILAKRVVKLKHLFQVFPAVRRCRVAYKFNRKKGVNMQSKTLLEKEPGELMIAPPIFELKFQMAEPFQRKVKDMYVENEDIESLYKK